MINASRLLQNIRIRRLSEDQDADYAVRIEPADRSWSLLLRRDNGTPELRAIGDAVLIKGTAQGPVDVT